MLPSKLKLEILTPHSPVYSQEVSSVVLPGSEGYFGVFPGHTPFLTALKVGEIKVVQDGAESYFATSGGIAEVLPDSISILSETAESAKEIDVKRAEEARARAREKIDEGRENWDIPRADLALARAMNRIRIARKKQGR
jgi:F-type H+-transporting ATPase subunit epsilon